ncbi:MAG: PQQ-dependent catabolism-associated beta-propeller protein [Hyphomicrobiales bacterium]
MPIIWPGAPLLALAIFVSSECASAKGTGLVFVANEKSNTITILDADHKVVESFPTCGRPRGMHFTAGRDGFFLACGDDDTIAVYDIATRKLTKRFRDIPDPETFDLHPDGRHLYASNEDDALVSVIDVETGTTVAEFETGEEPEGVLITADGKFAFATSEAANLVHVIDTAKGEVIKDIVTGTRPRRMALTPDGKELWVSAELSGIVDIIDVASLTALGKVEFLPKGMRREQVTPVDVLITGDGATAYVALGRANHVAVVDVKSRAVLDYLLVGKRPWGLKLNKDESLLYVANGLSDDVTIIETASNRSLISVAVGQVPYGILIDDE